MATKMPYAGQHELWHSTMREPPWVAENIARLNYWGRGPEIRVVSVGDLWADLLDAIRGGRARAASIPGWTRGPDGRSAPLDRNCTRDYKIRPIVKEVRASLGVGPRQWIGARRVRELRGISADEIERAKDSGYKWIETDFPLLNAMLNRSDCERIIRDAGLPVPLKSSCYFCPWHEDAYWVTLRDEHPDEWAKAVAVDYAIRDMTRLGVKSPVFLHRSLVPLDLVRFKPDEPSLFAGSCMEGCNT